MLESPGAGKNRACERDTQRERERLREEPQGHKESWELNKDGHVCQSFYLDHERLLHIVVSFAAKTSKIVLHPRY